MESISRSANVSAVQSTKNPGKLEDSVAEKKSERNVSFKSLNVERGIQSSGSSHGENKDRNCEMVEEQKHKAGHNLQLMQFDLIDEKDSVRVRSLWKQFAGAFSLLLLITFAFSALAVITNLSMHYNPTPDIGVAIWWSFLQVINIVGTVVVFRYLAPDAWENRPFLQALAITNVAIWAIRTIAYLQSIRENHELAQFVFLLDAVISSAVIFGMNIWALSTRRQLNYCLIREHIPFWLMLIPSGILFFLATWTRYFNASAFILVSIITLVIYFIAAFLSLAMREDTTYLLGGSLGSIFILQLIATATRLIQESMENVPYNVIIIAFIIQSLFFLAIVMLREVMENVSSIEADAVFPPLFSLQMAEELYVNLLFIRVSLSVEFAVTLVVITIWNLLRDSGVGQEIWFRFVRQEKREERIAMLMIQEYFFTQQNAVAEVISSPCAFIIVLTEYLLEPYGNQFARGLSRSSMEELLFIYAIVMVVKVANGYLAWRLFKLRIKKLQGYGNNIIEMSGASLAIPFQPQESNDKRGRFKKGTLTSIRQNINNQGQANEGNNIKMPSFRNGMSKPRQETRKTRSITVANFFRALMPDSRITKNTAAQWGKHKIQLGLLAVVVIASTKELIALP